MIFQFPELNKLIYDLGRAPKEVKEGAGMAVKEVIERVEASGKSFAPVREGDLRDSISSEVTAGEGMIVGEAGPNDVEGEGRHGRFIEWGTANMAPQAFMGPALDRHSHELDELLGSAGERSVSPWGKSSSSFFTFDA